MQKLPRLSSAVPMLFVFGPAFLLVPAFLLGPAFLLVPALLQGQATSAADEAAFLRAAGENFGFPHSELEVIRRWGLSSGEIPVVLFLAGRAGVSPDVLVTQRSIGESWMAIAGAYALHAGDFHVQIDGPYGPLAGVYDRFNGRPASEWRDISLSDDEVVGLVNVSFLARYLRVSPGRAAQELGQGGGMVGAFRRLGGGSGP